VQVGGGAAKRVVSPLGRGIVAATSRGIAWATNVKVDGASRLRLHLSNVKLPDDAVLWVYGGNDTTAFGRELIDPSGGLWTPAAWGDTIHLELEIGAAETASFAVDEVLELLDAARSVKPSDTPSCLVDVMCVTQTPLPLDNVKRAIAHLEFVVPEGGAACSGGLVNDAQSDGTPYLITANHCISTQSAASSLQAYFDWTYASCVSTTIPPLSSVPKASGASLLATKSADSGSDVTLLRLNSLPANRFLLGWTNDRTAVQTGMTLYRISHPAPSGFGVQPQQYSTSAVTASGPRCGLVASNFVFATNQIGGTYAGSSGAPDLLADGRIAGQLFGGCAPVGHDPQAGCDAAVLNVDGAFSASFAALQPFLNPSAALCTPSATVACLDENRFSVRIDWKTSGGQTGQGQVINLTDDSVLFWFFGPNNVEVLVKVLNGCPLSNTFWVFSAAATDVEYTITVADTLAGKSKTYFHAGGSAAPAVTDTNAFATCP
jgi:lysyl endopeptidase